MAFGRSRPQARTMLIKNSPDNETAKSNRVAVNPQDFPTDAYVLIDDKQVLTTKAVNNVLPGTIGLSGIQRFGGSWSTDQNVTVVPFDLASSSRNGGAYLGTVNLEIDFFNRNRTTNHQYDPDEMAKAFLIKLQNLILQPTQLLLFEFKGVYFELRVMSTQVVKLDQIELDDVPTLTAVTNRGIVVNHTSVNFFKAQNSVINLKASANRPKADAIIRPDFKFEDMGIGGLDKEFTSIFRRAFASRIFPPALIEKLGIQHVKGMLLYGPPGTGKTLIARQIGKMLNAREPKIVNGPDMLSKYVGESEGNIRKLFQEAEDEYKKKGEESALHIIIFDELDSIFKQRGSKSDGTGVADNLVNQLLAKMDGVEQLNNILVIGMTNRRDLIDSALLRPGRFEVQVEIQLPDEKGRLQILEIKTKKMRDNGGLGSDVDLPQLAKLTKNFSGAEIEGLIKSATSFALNKHIKIGTIGSIKSDFDNTILDMSCFLNALEEVKPAFGVHEEDLMDKMKGGILKYSTRIDAVIDRVQRDIEQTKLSERFNFSSLLMYGPAGSGKTALASFLALQSKFPFIRMIAADELIGMSESNKVSHIDNTFRDAYKSPLNILIVDDIEAIIDYVPIGPRFSSVVLRALITRLKSTPPEGKRLIVISTTSNYTLLKHLDMLNCFNDEIPINSLSTLSDLNNVMKLTNFGTDEVRQVILTKLEEVFQTDKINISIKKVLYNIDTCKFGSDPVEDLVQLMIESNRL